MPSRHSRTFAWNPIFAFQFGRNINFPFFVFLGDFPSSFKADLLYTSMSTHFNFLRTDWNRYNRPIQSTNKQIVIWNRPNVSADLIKQSNLYRINRTFRPTFHPFHHGKSYTLVHTGEYRYIPTTMYFNRLSRNLKSRYGARNRIQEPSLELSSQAS